MHVLRAVRADMERDSARLPVKTKRGFDPVGGGKPCGTAEVFARLQAHGGMKERLLRPRLRRGDGLDILEPVAQIRRREAARLDQLGALVLLAHRQICGQFPPVGVKVTLRDHGLCG
jgi:hypothetical protein